MGCPGFLYIADGPDLANTVAARKKEEVIRRFIKLLKGPIPPEDGLEFIKWEMVPIPHRVEHLADGRWHYVPIVTEIDDNYGGTTVD